MCLVLAVQTRMHAPPARGDYTYSFGIETAGYCYCTTSNVLHQQDKAVITVK